MADAKISNATAFPNASALGGTEKLPAVQSAANVNITPTQIKTFTSSSPTLVTPNLGTPSAGVLTSCTGLPISTGVSGLGTGVATALGINTGSAGAPVLFNGALGTPSSGTLTNATGLPVSTGISGLGSNVATFLATPSSANLASAITDETGTGVLVFGTSPTISTKLTITGATETASNPALEITQTWNNGAVNFTLSKMTITNTASDGYGFFADWKVGTNSVYKFRQDGSFTTRSVSCNDVGSSNSNAAIDFIGSKWTVATVSGGQIGFGSDASQVYAGLDAVFVRVAAGVIKVTNASTGGSAIGTTPVTVANLPAAGTAGSGARAFVTDATATTFASTVSGGGSNKVPVYSDGTNWLIG